jgi:hypothetical protein
MVLVLLGQVLEQLLKVFEFLPEVRIDEFGCEKPVFYRVAGRNSLPARSSRTGSARPPPRGYA